MEHGEDLSLAEYIRRSKVNDQFTFLRLRKQKRQNVDHEELDNSLDEYIRDARADPSQQNNEAFSQQNNKATASYSKDREQQRYSKFDRKSMRSDDDSEEEENQNNTNLGNLDEDVDMKPVENAEHQEEDDVLKDMFQFQTVESKYGVRVRSQQWRLLPENLEDRPEGMKRLEFLPLDENERYHRVHHGKVDKNRSRTSSTSSNFSNRNNMMTVEAIRAHGTFIEKGSFTIKIGDRNGDGRKGVIGIERAKRIHQEVPPAPVNIPVQSAPAAININMNWDGFFNGIKTQTARPDSADEKLNVAAKNLLQLLQNKRDSGIES